MILLFILLINIISFEIIDKRINNKIHLGLKNEIINSTHSCSHFFIPTNFKHIQIDIRNMNNIYKIIISDKPLDSCEINKCSSLSNICQCKKL